jgi:predicted Zn-ribbon and HTH transcriptional regulator
MGDEFLDFMVSGGDDFINGYKCAHCGKWINPEDIDGKSKCPHCDEILN